MLCNRSSLYRRASRPSFLNAFLQPRYAYARQFSSSQFLQNAPKMPDKADTQNFQDRPPYRIQTPDEFGPVKWHGKCECGQVTYKVNRERPLNAKYCHCRGCQVTHGAPFQWAAIFHKSDLTFTKGTEGLSFYSTQTKSREYQLPTKVACAHCRSPIMDEGRNVCLIFPELIDYEASGADHDKWRKEFEPKMHIFYSRRAMDIPDGKPKWAGLDEDSDLLDDYGRPKKDEETRNRM